MNCVINNKELIIEYITVYLKLLVKHNISRNEPIMGDSRGQPLSTTAYDALGTILSHPGVIPWWVCFLFLWVIVILNHLYYQCSDFQKSSFLNPIQNYIDLWWHSFQLTFTISLRIFVFDNFDDIDDDTNSAYKLLKITNLIFFPILYWSFKLQLIVI